MSRYVIYQKTSSLLFSYFPQTFDVHVNLLKCIPVPFSYGTQPSSSSSDPLPSDKVPWLETKVVITKQSSALRTKKGIVKNVLCNQATPSGLRLEIELTSVDAVNPFRRLTLDYDDVVELRCVVLN